MIAAAFAFLTTEAARRAFDFDRGVVVARAGVFPLAAAFPTGLAGSLGVLRGFAAFTQASVAASLK